MQYSAVILRHHFIPLRSLPVIICVIIKKSTTTSIPLTKTSMSDRFLDKKEYLWATDYPK